MWYWHPDFDAPYDYREGHFIPNPVATFNEEWLSGNGIGALIVTDREEFGPFPDPREAARQNPLFDYQVTVGNWDLYLVRNSTSVVTNGTVMPVALDIENQSITATFESAEGIVDIRRNWFPRWEAFADGEEVDVTRTSNGYMQITVPEGTQSVELQYAATWSDWLGRLAAVLGLVVVVALGVGPRSRGSFRNRNAQDV
jgi:hypothetical protein